MPDTPDTEFFWSWMQKQQNPLSGLGMGRYWTVIESVLTTLKQKDLANVGENSISADRVKTEMKDLLGKVALHGFQSGKGIGFKLSTIEWVALSIIDNMNTP
jgi:hypothetical protein